MANSPHVSQEPFEELSWFQELSKKYIVNPLINHLLPRDVLIKYLKESKSPLIQESLKRPGSWRCMKISYENKPPVDFIDLIVSRCGTFPMGLRNRKRLVVRKMVNLIQHYLDEGVSEVNVVAVGAGTGANTIEALSTHPNKNVIAHLFDIADACYSR